MYFTEAYLSSILRKPVLNPAGDRVGIISDLVVAAGDPFPVVSKILVSNGRKSFIINWSIVNILTKKFMIINKKIDDISIEELTEGELFLARDLMDKQVVDTSGYRVVRINDLKIGKVNDEIRLFAADVGLRGLLRRLGGEGLLNFMEKITGRKVINERLISWNQIEPLETSMGNIRLKVPFQKIAQLHPADIAEIITQLNPLQRKAVLTSLNNETAADTLQEIDRDVKVSILQSLEDEHASDLLEEMDPDAAADLLGDLPKEKATELLGLMEREEAEDVQELLEHEEDTAGGIMTTDYIAFSQGLSLEEAINELRRLASEAQHIYHLYVVDDSGHLAGVLSLRDLVVGNPQKLIKDIMANRVLKVNVKANHKEVANLIAKYNLLAVPVVDDDDILLGIVTVDDVLDIIMPRQSRRGYP